MCQMLISYWPWFDSVPLSLGATSKATCGLWVKVFGKWWTFAAWGEFASIRQCANSLFSGSMGLHSFCLHCFFTWEDVYSVYLFFMFWRFWISFDCRFNGFYLRWAQAVVLAMLASGAYQFWLRRFAASLHQNTDASRFAIRFWKQGQALDLVAATRGLAGRKMFENAKLSCKVVRNCFWSHVKQKSFISNKLSQRWSILIIQLINVNYYISSLTWKYRCRSIGFTFCSLCLWRQMQTASVEQLRSPSCIPFLSASAVVFLRGIYETVDPAMATKQDNVDLFQFKMQKEFKRNRYGEFSMTWFSYWRSGDFFSKSKDALTAGNSKQMHPGVVPKRSTQNDQVGDIFWRFARFASGGPCCKFLLQQILASLKFAISIMYQSFSVLFSNFV